MIGRDELPDDEPLEGGPLDEPLEEVVRDEPPLREFAAAWRSIEAPAPTALLDVPDDATLATIGWLRAAWQASAPPPVRLPWSVRARPLVRRSEPWIAITLAAAATLLLLLRLATPVSSPPATPAEELAVARKSGPPAIAPPAVEPSPPSIATPLVLPDRMELRSGKVRLILFTPSAAPPAHGTPTESSR